MPQENSDWRTRVEKVLALERATGYADRSTTCSLEAFLRQQCPELASQAAGYAAADLSQREAIVDRVEAFLRTPTPQSASPSESLTAPLLRVRGIGAKRAALMAKLGVETIEDLLLFLPRRLEDRTRFASIGTLQAREDACVRATVRSVTQHAPRRGMSLVRAVVADDTGSLDITWFNQPWIADQIKPGIVVDVFGRVDTYRGRFQMNSPVWEPEGTGKEIGHWVPVYPATEGLSPRWIRTLLEEVLARHLTALPDALPEQLRTRLGLLLREDAIRAIHHPDDPETFERARQSLAFEEFYLLQLGLLDAVRSDDGRVHTPREGLMGSLLSGLPFSLTSSQRAAVDQILADLAQPRRMMRLLQGDVGSGKTLVALAAAVTAIDGGCQVAYMAPTEILAEQHSQVFRRQLAGLPISVSLLTGRTPKKAEVQQRVAHGEVDLLVGTHALIQEATTFDDLGLIIIDEQHRFGVVQRSAIEEKGSQADVLVMSATPIPRTIALTLYGQFDVTILDEMPTGTRSVKTRWVDACRRASLYDEVGTLLQSGRKGYVILPLVEESEKVDANAAVQVADEMRHRFAEHGVGLLHGRMPSEEKGAAMAAFRDGQSRLLVSTTVIEVGIDVQDADFMVIENADRFGLSQLHQLRGRIGRAGQPAVCYALASAKTDDARDRLAAFERYADGFAIAEEDLRIRGPGDVVGTQQHGYFTLLRAVDLSRDLDLMRHARQAAKERFDQGVPAHVMSRVEQRFGDVMRWVRV